MRQLKQNAANRSCVVVTGLAHTETGKQETICQTSLSVESMSHRTNSDGCGFSEVLYKFWLRGVDLNQRPLGYEDRGKLQTQILCGADDNPRQRMNTARQGKRDPCLTSLLDSHSPLRGKDTHGERLAVPQQGQDHVGVRQLKCRRGRTTGANSFSVFRVFGSDKQVLMRRDQIVK
jgi:hypothetical protein